VATERPKVTQHWLNRLPRPDDLPDIPWVQWRVENQEEVARFLEDFMVRIKRVPGDQLLVQTAFTKGDIQLSPGDVLVIRPATAENPNERLGVIRTPNSVAHREADGIKDNPILEAAKLH
jgi:hypothetical protein